MFEKTVLFVDDDKSMIHAYKRAFLAEPYRLLFANNGTEALEIMAENPVHVLAVDVCMPGMSGLELIQTTKEKFPYIVPILISGQPNLDSRDVSTLVKSLHKKDIFRFVAKSVGMQDATREAIREAFDYIESKGVSVE